MLQYSYLCHYVGTWSGDMWFLKVLILKFCICCLQCVFIQMIRMCIFYKQNLLSKIMEHIDRTLMSSTLQGDTSLSSGYEIFLLYLVEQSPDFHTFKEKKIFYNDLPSSSLRSTSLGVLWPKVHTYLTDSSAQCQICISYLHHEYVCGSQQWAAAATSLTCHSLKPGGPENVASGRFRWSIITLVY